MLTGVSKSMFSQLLNKKRTKSQPALPKPRAGSDGSLSECSGRAVAHCVVLKHPFSAVGDTDVK